MTKLIHDKLAALAADINGRSPTTSVVHEGRTYVLELLKPEWDEWALAHVVGATASAVLINVRVPILAAALRSIDGVGLETLIQADPDLPRDGLENPKFMLDWRRRQLLGWIRENVDDIWIETLYKAYNSMKLDYERVVGAKLGKKEENLA